MWVTPKQFAEQVVDNVRALPDRPPPVEGAEPEDESLSCTAEELATCVTEAFEHFHDGDDAPKAVKTT